MSTGAVADADDLARWGEVEAVPLSRLQKLAGGALARSWSQIPHVTHHDEAPVDALETLRAQLNGNAEGPKLSLLPFVIKALARVLQAFPRFNASLAPDGNSLLLKRCVHIGVVVETPQGLLVPVIHDCDRKPLGAIAAELADKAARARARGLPLPEMSGGGFSISSLGGLGGTGFTPLINAPEVAILGLTPLVQRLALVDAQVRASTVLPLSLSYDHRVINGADAARFCRALAQALAEPATLLEPTPEAAA